MSSLDISTNDTLPIIVGVITDDNSNVEDISGWTITLNATNESSVISIPATLSQPVSGEFRINLSGEDFTAANWSFEIKCVNSSGGIQRAWQDDDGDLVYLNVREAIA